MTPSPPAFLLTNAAGPAAGYALLTGLQVVFDAQARYVLSRLTLDGPLPDAGVWLRALADVARPVLLRSFQEGLVRQRMKFRTRPARPKKQLGVSFDLFNPRVLDAVESAVLLFCEETNATATLRAEEAREAVRQALREGLPRGDALRTLAACVMEIYADPYRAFRIATTEPSRAMHQGQLLAMKEEPLVRAKEWLASSDACPACLEIDGQQRPLDEPFVVLPGGGPYAAVMTPPLHPHCFCALQEVL